MPVLGSYLSPGCILLLDDTQRPEERAIVRRWCIELDASVIDEADTFAVLLVGSRSTRPAAALT